VEEKPDFILCDFCIMKCSLGTVLARRPQMFTRSSFHENSDHPSS
jgi:hypothetical protein